MINNVDDYEKQIQIIYNRLIENDFEVSYNYLNKDVKTNKSTKMRSNQLAGNIINFDFSQIKYDKEGNIYIKPNDKLLKVSTGNLLEILTNIFNYIKRSGGQVEEVYNEAIKSIIKRKNNITKKDLEKLNTLYYLTENWSNFYNSNFIKAMENKDWDDIKLTTTFIRSIYNDKMKEQDWKILSDEAYLKIHNLRKVFNDYTYTIESLSYDNENLNIPLDDKTKEIYTYILKEHTKGKKSKNTKSVTIDGVTYSSITDAAQKLGISRQAIHKRLKNQ
jgi:hypothetical protein